MSKQQIRARLLDALLSGVSMAHMGANGNAYRPWHLVCFRRALGIEGAAA